MKYGLTETSGTRWYLRGTQKLVSTYQLPEPPILGGGYSRVVKTQSAKFWPTFDWGGGIFLGSQRQSAKFWPSFHIRGGGGYSWLLWNRVFFVFWPQNLLRQNLVSLARHCVTDSLSHIIRMWRLKRTFTLKFFQEVISCTILPLESRAIKYMTHCWI